MMNNAPLVNERDIEALLSLQSGNGAFLSEVTSKETMHTPCCTDENGFVTAQVAIILTNLIQHTAPNPTLESTLSAALNFIEDCESTELPGSFRFYSNTPSPRQLSIDLLPDIDDTSLAWAALVLGGRRSISEAAAALVRCIVPTRPGERLLGDPLWVRGGALRTWLGDAAENPVDLCANTNVVFACQICGLSQSPLAQGAIHTIQAGLRTTRGAPEFIRRITPYYAHPAELSHALARAVSAGAHELQSSLELVAKFETEDRNSGRPSHRPLYCNAHGSPLWRSQALQLARRCADALAYPSTLYKWRSS